MSTAFPIISLLAGIGVLLVGSGLFGTLLALRAGLEGFADQMIGLVMSAYFVGFFAGTFVCSALIIHPVVWLALRVFTGVCLAGLYTVIESWLNAQTPNAQRGKVFAAYMIVTLLALTLGQALITCADPAGFTLFAIASLLMSMALVPIASTSLVQPTPVTTPRLGLRFLYATSPAAVAGALVSGMVIGAFWGMGPVFAQRIGLDNAGVAALMGATILGGAALQWPIGHLSDRVDRRRVLAAVGAIGGMTALVAAVAANGTTDWLLAAVFVFGGLAFSVYPVSVAHLNDHLQPEQVLEGSSGLLLLHGLGTAAGPAIVGVLGPRSLLVYYAATLAVLALFVALRIRHAPPVAMEEHVPFTPMVRTSPEALTMLAKAAEDAAQPAPHAGADSGHPPSRT